MNIFLRLKNWQFFGLLCIFHIFSMIAILLNEQPTMMFIGFLLFLGSYLCWFYALATYLNKRLPKKVKMNLVKFKWFLSILSVYLFMFGVFAFYFWIKTNSFGIFNIILPFHLLSMFFMLYCLNFVAKSLKAVELQRTVTFSDYIEEFFIICFFYPIGIWIIQPRINKMFNKTLHWKGNF